MAAQGLLGEVLQPGPQRVDDVDDAGPGLLADDDLPGGCLAGHGGRRWHPGRPPRQWPGRDSCSTSTAARTPAVQLPFTFASSRRPPGRGQPGRVTDLIAAAQADSEPEPRRYADDTRRGGRGGRRPRRLRSAGRGRPAGRPVRRPRDAAGWTSTTGCCSSPRTRRCRCSSGCGSPPSSPATSTSSSWSAWPRCAGGWPAGITTPSATGATPRERLAAVSETAHRLVARHAALFADAAAARPSRRPGVRLLRWADLDERRAQADARALRRPDPAGAHAARRRPGPPVPLHLRAVAEPRRRRPRRGDRRRALRPGQGAAAAAALPADRSSRGRGSSPSRTSSRRTCPTLFPGLTGRWRPRRFRVTRNEDLEVDDDVDNLLLALERELSRRRFGTPVRLEVDDDDQRPGARRCWSGSWRSASTRSTGCRRRSTWPRLWMIADLDLPGPALPRAGAGDAAGAAHGRRAARTSSPRMRRGDVLVHHPYDSFATTRPGVHRAGGQRPCDACHQARRSTGPAASRRSSTR